MSSNHEVADFTTGNFNPIVCQRCLQSFEEGTELYYMRDRKTDQGGKRICGGCDQYYIRKTEAHETELALSLSLSMNIAFSNNKSNSRSCHFCFCANHSDYTACSQPSAYKESCQWSSKTWWRIYHMQKHLRHTNTHLQVKITQAILVNYSVWCHQPNWPGRRGNTSSGIYSPFQGYMPT